MDRKQRRKFALERFKRKWGMSDYRIFVRSYNRYHPETLLIHKSVDLEEAHIKKVSEIVTHHSFLKRFHILNTQIIIYESSTVYQTFYSLDEVKQYMLIKKIAGV